MKAKTLFVASLILFAALAVWLYESGRPAATTSEPIMVFCAPSLKAAVEAIAKEYEREKLGSVQLDFKPSQALLTSIEISHRGELFLPADDSYSEMARSKNLLAESIPIGRQHAVLAVKRGNEKKIKTLADLLRPDVKIALAGDAAAIGKIGREALTRSGNWTPLATKAVFKGTVNDVANDVKLGAVDAGIVWNTNVAIMPDLEAIEDPALKEIVATVSVSVLKSANNPTAALRFARFLAAQDKGMLEFKRAGFETVDGDAWKEMPELKLFAGAMLRPAIEQTISDFETRERVRVTRVYNGCGILVSQMRTAQPGAEATALPDAYFACDKSFMTQVSDLFLEPVDVSQNQLVILVPKGNPNHIAQLKDLGKPGLRIGVGHEKQCALGALTALTFKTSGVFDRVMDNVKVQSATGDLLVNQLLTGSLDAVVAYISNAASSADKLDAIKIDIPCALAVQPLAASKFSQNKQLAGRLKDALLSAHSREIFESNGFSWKAAQPGEQK